MPPGAGAGAGAGALGLGQGQAPAPVSGIRLRPPVPRPGVPATGSALAAGSWGLVAGGSLFYML
jgi:hypothetical protein